MTDCEAIIMLKKDCGLDNKSCGDAHSITWKKKVDASLYCGRLEDGENGEHGWKEFGRR